MEKINLNATRIFARMLFALGDAEEVTFDIGYRLPVMLCRMNNLSTPSGPAVNYSLVMCSQPHLVKEIEVKFLVQDHRSSHPENLPGLQVFVQGIEISLAEISQDCLLDTQILPPQDLTEIQTGHRWFGTLWLELLERRGYFKNLPTGNAAGEQDAQPDA